MDWFHFTGITPALGENVVEICREACKAAKAHGVKISCDLNYRGKLWTREMCIRDSSKEGKLGVEGISSEILLEILKEAGASVEGSTTDFQPLTPADRCV